MPLTVYNEDDHPAQARSVYDRAMNINRFRRGEVFMYGFYFANSTQPTALATTGAAGCQIIIVHKRQGVGALGHYAGTPNALEILVGLEKMVAKLGGGAIDTVVYSAGTGAGTGGAAGQKAYEFTLIGGARLRCPGVRVLWPAQTANNNFGSAVYLPLTSEAALFHSMPEPGFMGSADGTEGVTAADYHMN